MSGRGTQQQGNKSTPRSKLWKKVAAKQNGQNSRQSQGNIVTKRDLNGGKITPPSNPPDVAYQPWFHVTLVDSFSSTKYDCKTNTIIKLLRRQLDPEKRGLNQETSGDKRFVVQIRIFSVQAWNLTGRLLALTVDDFSEAKSAAGGRDQLCGIVDTGSQNHTPCVGYLLPSALRQMVIRTDDIQGDDYIYTLTSGTSDQCVVYTRIAFRFDGPVRPPNLITPIVSCASLLSTGNSTAFKSLKQNREVREVLTRLKEISENTYAARPSTLKKIVDGIEYIGMAVVALGEEEGSAFENLASDISDLNFTTPAAPVCENQLSGSNQDSN